MLLREPRHGCRAGILIFLWPIPPSSPSRHLRRKMFTQRLEAAEPLERIALPTAKILECPAPAAVGIGSEGIEQRAQNGQLQTCDCLVVDQRRVAAMCEVALKVGCLRHCARAFGRAEFRNSRYLDEKNIEKEPARRRIRARPLGRVEKHRVQGIEPDHRRAEVGSDFGEAFEIAKIADTPIVFRPQQVELERDAPHRRLVGEACRHVTTPGNNDQPHFSWVDPLRFDP